MWLDCKRGKFGEEMAVVMTPRGLSRMSCWSTGIRRSAWTGGIYIVGAVMPGAERGRRRKLGIGLQGGLTVGKMRIQLGASNPLVASVPR